LTRIHLQIEGQFVELIFGVRHRAARFILVHGTKTRKNVPNEHKM
jgi:hypothetical protein